MSGLRSTPDHSRNAALLAFVRASLGTLERIEDVSRPVGRLSVVWRVTSPGGAVHYAKQHESPKLFGRELRAYEHWVPQLRSVPGIHIPEVIARDDALGALLVTALPHGVLVSELDPDAAQEPAHWQAGRFLRALHALPLDGPAPDIVAHMRALIPRYVLAYAACLEPAQFDAIVDALDEGRPFEGARFVCAHRDFSPRNWLLTAGGSLGVFDWERAQPDIWLSDISRMEFDVWPARPALRDAFFKGYGTALTERSREQLRLATLIHAVASVGWAASRNDTHFEALGRATIRRLNDAL